MAACAPFGNCAAALLGGRLAAGTKTSSSSSFSPAASPSRAAHLLHAPPRSPPPRRWVVTAAAAQQRAFAAAADAGNDAADAPPPPTERGGPGTNHTVLVCGNKTCRQQGALNTMQFFQQLVPVDCTVKRVGCLGRCGNGPNCVLLPSELAVGHCNTAAHVARLIERQVVHGEGAETIARTLQLKLDGNALMEMGDPSAAEAAYSAAINLLPVRGAASTLHILYSNRSAARLAQVGRNPLDALADAQASMELAPQWFRAHSRAGDALLALGRKDEALEAMERTLDLQPSLMGDAVFMAKFKDLSSSKRERRAVEVPVPTPAGQQTLPGVAVAVPAAVESSPSSKSFLTAEEKQQKRKELEWGSAASAAAASPSAGVTAAKIHVL